MKLWLDDLLDPEQFGFPGWVWVKTSAEAIAAFKTGTVERASLDHDLEELHYQDGGCADVPHADDNGKTGYTVALFLEEFPEFFPFGGVNVHSMKENGRRRMAQSLWRSCRSARRGYVTTKMATRTGR